MLNIADLFASTSYPCGLFCSAIFQNYLLVCWETSVWWFHSVFWTEKWFRETKKEMKPETETCQSLIWLPRVNRVQAARLSKCPSQMMLTFGSLIQLLGALVCRLVMKKRYLTGTATCIVLKFHVPLHNQTSQTLGNRSKHMGPHPNPRGKGQIGETVGAECDSSVHGSKPAGGISQDGWKIQQPDWNQPQISVPHDEKDGWSQKLSHKCSESILHQAIATTNLINTQPCPRCSWCSLVHPRMSTLCTALITAGWITQLISEIRVSLCCCCWNEWWPGVPVGCW